VGGSSQITGCLSLLNGTALAGQNVTVQFNNGTGWYLIDTVITNGSGYYTKTWGETLPVGVYQLRSIYLGDGTYENATSPIVTIAVATTGSTHKIEILDGGITLVNDNFIFKNSESNSRINFTFCVPISIFPNLANITANDSEGKGLSIIADVDVGNSSFRGYTVLFSRAVNPNENYSFSIRYIFSGLVTFDNNLGSFNATFPETPSLTPDFSPFYCNVSIIFPKGATPTTSIPNFTVYYNVTAYNAKLNSTTFTGTIQVFECETATREILIDSFMNTYITDTYTLKNLGSKIKSINIPKIGDIDSVFDNQGPLSYSISDNSLSIVSRFSVENNWSCRFSVKYKVPNCIRQVEWWGSYELDYDLLSGFNWVVKSLTVTIILPDGTGNVNINWTPTTSLYKDMLKTYIVYQLSSVTPYDHLGFNLKFERPFIWVAFYPVIWLIMVAAIVCSLILVFRRRKAERLAAVSVSAGLIKSFVQAAGERVALITELNELEEKRHAGKILKFEYKSRKSSIEQHLSALDKDLSNIKPQMRNIGPKYASAVSSIEMAEAQLTTAQMNLRTLEAQYKSGKLTKDAFEGLRRDYVKRIDDARTRINATLMDLKSEID
jgi:hypothetical protein